MLNRYVVIDRACLVKGVCASAALPAFSGALQGAEWLDDYLVFSDSDRENPGLEQSDRR